MGAINTRAWSTKVGASWVCINSDYKRVTCPIISTTSYKISEKLIYLCHWAIMAQSKCLNLIDYELKENIVLFLFTK